MGLFHSRSFGSYRSRQSSNYKDCSRSVCRYNQCTFKTYSLTSLLPLSPFCLP